MDERPLTPEWLDTFAERHAPDALRRLMLEGVSCDALPGASGIFGHDPGNPVPVNGIIGEVVYLSRLVTENGERLLFHRIGCLGRVDAYEAVTFSGSEWFLLFLDMYHPTMSRKAPVGFSFSSDSTLRITGFGRRLGEFPQGLLATGFRDCQEAGVYVEPETIREVLAVSSFVRPDAHRGRLELLEGELAAEDHQRPFREEVLAREAEERWQQATGGATPEEVDEFRYPLAGIRDRWGRAISIRRIDIRYT